MNAVDRPDFSFPAIDRVEPIIDLTFDDRAVGGDPGADGSGPDARLDAAQALSVLGLRAGASMTDVTSAYRWLRAGIELERRHGSSVAARRELNAAYATLRLLTVD